MLLAERLNDPTRAQRAVAQIEVAFETMRYGGSTFDAASYETLLPKARALVARLAR
jgi:hypothetical protein